MRVLIPVWLACFVLACPASPKIASSSTNSNSSVPLPVEVHPVRYQDWYAVRRDFYGQVRDQRKSALGFEQGGKVEKIYVREGEWIKRGQPIARLDDDALRAQRRALRAQLRQAQAEQSLSRLSASRIDLLATKNYASKQSNDEARLKKDVAQARVAQLRANYQAIELQIQKTRLTAPFDGRVAQRLIDEGTVVGNGTPILRFHDDQQREAVVGVPLSVKSEATPGSTHRLYLNNTMISAQVRHHVPSLNTSTRTLDLIFALPKDLKVVDGQSVRLQMQRHVSDNGFWLPLAALRTGLRGLWEVYRIKRAQKHHQVIREAVEVLYNDSERVFVRGTLKDGDMVIVSGTHRVVPGQHVIPLGVSEHS